MNPVRRALPFMPGDSTRKMQKAAGLGVDSVVMGLEDGVALSQKAVARATGLEALRAIDFGRTERLVRISPVGSGLEIDDIAATLSGEPDDYVIPKVKGPEDVVAIGRVVHHRRPKLGLPDGRPQLALVETARGVMCFREIAGSDPNLVALIFGSEDLAGEIGARCTPEGFEVLHARSAVVAAAVAHGLLPIDSAFTDLEDRVGLARDAATGASRGHEGKLAVHPKQVGPIAEAFTPSDEAIAAAQRVAQAHAEHRRTGTGAFVLDGRTVDRPVVHAAEGVLARARAGKPR